MARKLSGLPNDKMEECGCEVRWATNALVDGINYCPMHTAAPEMLAAVERTEELYAQLEEAAKPLDGMPAYAAVWMDYQRHRQAIRKALAAARGQEVGA